MATSVLAPEIVASPDADALCEAGWQRLPASYRPPSQAPTLPHAQQWCRELATSHYENFHVGTWFLPKRLRPHFYAIYAFCRVSDDLGDETGDTAISLALLRWWQGELDACYAGRATHPVFVSLAETVRACAIPQQPFDDLLTAFRRDQVKTRFANMDEVLDYCRYSANPVGRLVLYCCGYTDAERFALSDHTCSALQLANFWQDLRTDLLDRDRIYLPQDSMAAHGVTEQTLREDAARRQSSPNVRALLREQVEYARQMFHKGFPLIGSVDRALAMDLDLFSRGGLEILRSIDHEGYNTIAARPAISKARKAALLLHAVRTRLAGSSLTA